MSRVVEINHAVWQLALAVKACPSYRREVDEGLPEDSRTQAILDEIREQARAGAQGITPVLYHPQLQGRATTKAPKTSQSRTCPECGTEFMPTRINGRYCCNRCKRTAQYRRENEAKREKTGQMGAIAV